jgi:reverse gyrase
MNLLRVLIFTGVVMVFVSAPDLTFSQEKQQPSHKSEMKTMGKMSMDEMMKECREHHQSMMKSIDQMTKMMEAAKQSNDPVKMRAALDQGQKQLSEMKEHMTMCGNMMSMMEKMPGMGGMMKSQLK